MSWYEDTHPKPKIILFGEYLREYGFEVGDSIEIDYKPGEITIRNPQYDNGEKQLKYKKVEQVEIFEDA